MADIKKAVNDLMNQVNDVTDQAVRKFEEATKGATGVLQTERRKMELRSQIGKHQRNVQKAYARLGELYYRHETEGTEMGNAADIIDILKSNNKVIELLNEQLQQIDPAKTEDTK